LNIRPLICLALIHTLVDSYAQVLAPLWPRLQQRAGLTLTLLFGVWQAATSVSQPLFGYWGDRFNTRWVVSLGPALGILCVSLIGFAGGPASTLALLLVGGLGMGAFHPEAAVGVVEASGTRAARGLALFSFGGMVGLGVGPVVSGALAHRHGLPSLAWLLLPGLLLLGLLLLYGRPASGPHPARQHQPVSLAEVVDGRWLSVLLLLAVATLRVVPALGVPVGVAFLLDREGHSPQAIGAVQSLFLLAGGLGTLVCPLFTRPGRELVALVTTTLAASGFLLLLTVDQPAAYYAGLVGSGLLLQGSIPILIAYSQRLLPRGRRLAASLTLGASWGLGGLVVAMLKDSFAAAGRLDSMLAALIPFALAASLASCLLPRLAARPVHPAGGVREEAPSLLTPDPLQH
jgi:FSR family fosmidomycin resistance protein-like MFS transporter